MKRITLAMGWHSHPSVLWKRPETRISAQDSRIAQKTHIMLTYHSRAMEADALDLALDPGNTQASDTEAINTECDILDYYDRQMSPLYNIRIIHPCSLSQESQCYSSSMAQLFDWCDQATNNPDSDQRPVKYNFEMISKVETEDNSVDSDDLFISSNKTDSGMTKVRKVIAEDNSVDSDILNIPSKKCGSGMKKVGLHPIDNAAKLQLSSLQTDRGQRNQDNLPTDDPENLVCDTKVPECLRGTTLSKHQVVRFSLQKDPLVMNQYNTPILVNDVMQQIRDENKSDEVRSDVQTVENEESSNVFCCILAWSAQMQAKPWQCSCESRHKAQAIHPSPKHDWDLESNDCSLVKLPTTRCEVSTKHGSAGMQYHCKTSKGKCKAISADPCSKFIQLEGHGFLGYSSGNKNDVGTTSKKDTRMKQKKNTARDRSPCVNTVQKLHK